MEKKRWNIVNQKQRWAKIAKPQKLIVKWGVYMSQAKFLINAELKPASLAACTLHGQQFAQSISSLPWLIPKDAILHLFVHKHDGLIGVEEMKNALSNHAISWMMMDDERSTWWQQGTGNDPGTVVDKTCCILQGLGRLCETTLLSQLLRR